MGIKIPQITKPKWLRLELLALFAISGLVLVFTVYFSLARYLGFSSEMLDLGNMCQAVWSATQGEPLVYTSVNGPVSRIAWHGEFIYYLLAPFYALVPSPVTLLVFQGVLFVLGAFPLYRLALRHLESNNYAILIAVIYLIYPVAMTAVLFDIHGDTLAMPFVLFSLDALDRRSRSGYLFWLLVSLSCKLYVVVPVVALGGILWLQKNRKFAIYSWIAAATWVVVVYLARAGIASGGFMRTAVESSTDYMNFYYHGIDQLSATLLLRVLSAMIALVPALVLGIHSPMWMTPGLIVALAVLLSNGPNNPYNYNYHHYALAVPFLAVSMVYGAEELRRGNGNRLLKKVYGSRVWKREVVFTAILAGLFSFFFVQTPQSPLVRYFTPGDTTYLITPRDRFVQSWLHEKVPPEAPVLADSFLAPHLANRNILYSNYYTDGPGYLAGERYRQVLAEVDYVVLDVFSIYERSNPHTVATIMKAPDFALVENRDGLLLFQKAASKGLTYSIDKIPLSSTSTALAQFSDGISLIDFKTEEVGSRLYRFTYDWELTASTGGSGGMFGVTRLDGVAFSRFVNLPTFALFPPTSWKRNDIVREVFEVKIPEDLQPGQYALRLGSYDSNNFLAEVTDKNSRIGEEIQIGYLQVH